MLILLACFAIYAEKPAALVAFEHARSAIVSGSIEFSVEQSGLNEKPLRYRAKYARNGDLLFEELGDPDGWTTFVWDESARKPVPATKIPHHYLHNSEGYWEHEFSTSNVRLWNDLKYPGNPFQSKVKDIRNLGTFATPDDTAGLNANVFDTDDERFVIKGWGERSEGTQRIVTATTAIGSRIVWWINPEKGWNAERIAIFPPGETTDAKPDGECRIRLRLTGGAWFPEEATYWRYGKVDVRVSITSCHFNKATDPASLPAAILALEPGFSIATQGFRLFGNSVAFWSGTGIVDSRQWYELMKAGATIGPTLQAEMRGEFSPYYTDEQRQRFGQERTAFREKLIKQAQMTEWERYVSQFIERHRLDAEQAQKAEVILKECEQKAKPHREKLIAMGTPTTAPASQESSTGRAQDSTELMRNTQAIKDIFEKQLKPRLEKLPTRAQRERVKAP